MYEVIINGQLVDDLFESENQANEYAAMRRHEMGGSFRINIVVQKCAETEPEPKEDK